MEPIEYPGTKPVNIGICFDISYNNSSIFTVEFEADQHYLEDRGRSDVYYAKFTYDFQQGLLLDWDPPIYDYLRPNDNMDFNVYNNNQFLFARSRDKIDDYNEEIELDALDRISKSLTKDKMQSLIEEIIINISPMTELI